MALTDNLIAYWKLNETSSTRSDSVGTNHLTDVNSVGTNGGKRGKSALFVAVNAQYLTINDNTDLSTGDIDFTLAGWIRLTSKSAIMRWGKWQTGALEYNIAYHTSDDRFRFEVSANGTSTGASVVANNLGSPTVEQWYFLVVWHDATGNTINIQINNGTADSTAHSGGVFDSTAPFRIGSNGDGATYWNGRVDELGFWKRVLTANEKTTLYAGGTGTTYPFTEFGARAFTKEAWLWVPAVHRPEFIPVPTL